MKEVKKSLCFKCLFFVYNRENQMLPLEDFFRNILGKYCIVCTLYDPRMPAMKKNQCKDFVPNT